MQTVDASHITKGDSMSWRGQISLTFSKIKNRTCLSQKTHTGPLYVQKPFYPEGDSCVHVYLLHPPAGIVSGDTLTTNIQAEPETAVLVTTPGATVVYKARKERPIQRQINHLKIASNASVEWFPLETILHNCAHFETTTIIDMDASSTFFGWEITSLGLPVVNQKFSSGEFNQTFKIIVDGKISFVERMNINESNRQNLLNSHAGLQAYMVTGFCIFGPIVSPSVSQGRSSDRQLQDMREKIDMYQNRQKTDCQFSITRLGSFIVGRYLGSSAEQARQGFTILWSSIRKMVFQKEACIPRIWAS